MKSVSSHWTTKKNKFITTDFWEERNLSQLFPRTHTLWNCKFLTKVIVYLLWQKGNPAVSGTKEQKIISEQRLPSFILPDSITNVDITNTNLPTFVKFWKWFRCILPRLRLSKLLANDNRGAICRLFQWQHSIPTFGNCPTPISDWTRLPSLKFPSVPSDKCRNGTSIRPR